MRTDDAQMNVFVPTLVGENIVCDLSQVRRQHAQIGSQNQNRILNDEPQCEDGICVLSWRPRRPEVVA